MSDFVSSVIVVALARVELADPDLPALRERVVASTLDDSRIRLRNAAAV